MQRELQFSPRMPKLRPDLPPHQMHSPTSRAAAEAIMPSEGSLEEAVYDCIVQAGEHGMTDAEVQTRLGLDGSTQRPRRVRLVEKGLVKDSGETRKTKTGRHAVVWVSI